MDMLLQTALIKYHLQAHQHTVEVTPLVGMKDPHLGTIATTGIPTIIIEIGTGSVIPDPTHTILDTGVTATMTPTAVTPDHSIDPHIVAPSCHRSSSSYHYHCDNHITDLHPIEIFPEMTADLHHTNPTNNIKQYYKPAQGSSSSLQTTPWKNKDRRHKQVTIDDPSSEYYSSDDQDRDSKDDLN